MTRIKWAVAASFAVLAAVYYAKHAPLWLVLAVAGPATGPGAPVVEMASIITGVIALGLLLQTLIAGCGL